MEAVNVDLVVLSVADLAAALDQEGGVGHPQKAGPLLAPPTETNAGISSHGRFGPSSWLTTEPNDGMHTVGFGM